MKMASELILAGAGVGLFVLGTLFGMAMERSAARNAREPTEEDLTDWEGDR
jgi:hypothetical protein